MTTGEIMFYGGIAGVILSAVILIAALGIFNRKRSKKLEEIMKDL